MQQIRTDWTKEQISEIYHSPLPELIYRAASVHRAYHDSSKIKISQLISIKTGGCAEDCSYCAQSARYVTEVEAHKTLSLSEVLTEASNAKASGVQRVCLSASWRNIPEGKQFDDVLLMIEKIKEMDMEVCCTLGMVNESQAETLAKAGISTYNHNVDTSGEFYPNIITTRTFDERIATINRLIDAGVKHCTGGILGLGESEDDRISMIRRLATLRRHPYTVPLNSLVAIPGTPLGEKKQVSVFEMARMIATVRIVMPATMIELAAGRKQMTDEGQALCFIAGANCIFVGTKLLTTPNPEMDKDMDLLKTLGLDVY